MNNYMQFEVFIKAFVMGLGLIVAIGAQNIFIIKTEKCSQPIW